MKKLFQFADSCLNFLNFGNYHVTKSDNSNNCDSHRLRTINYRLIAQFTFIAIFMVSCGKGTNEEQREENNIKTEEVTYKYPDVRKDTTIVEEYFGVKVADPYRWLEDANSGATKSWVRKQNDLTFSYLDDIPFRDDVLERLTDVWNYERFGTPFKKNDKYYFFKNDGLQNHAVMYVQDDLESEPTVVLDPNKFSSDGTVKLGNYSFSKDGRYLAYSTSKGGSDWRTVRVKDLENGNTLSDELKWVKFSGMAWKDGGFYYSRFKAPTDGNELSAKNEFQQVYYHKVGTLQADDELVFIDRANPDLSTGARTTKDERFLTLYTSKTTSGNALYFKDLSKNQEYFTPIVESFDNDFWVLDNFGDKLIVLTNHNAPNMRVITIDTKRPAEGNWRDLIPEAKEKLDGVDLIGGKIFATYIKDAQSQVKIFSENGRAEGELELPGIGTVGGFNGKRDDNMAFYNFTSFKQPNTIYTYDIEAGQSEVFKSPKVDFNADDYVTEQVFYESYDGTKIPMFVTHKKGIKKNSNNPTLLYGYGGFNISYLPEFAIEQTVFLENGGVYAVANIRGGGEYGKKWHKAGTKLQKQNVFNDFISAAEFLINEDYTSPDKLAIRGRSNGGLLVGACLTQRPELFKVALPAVGVMDMLRYHTFTIGGAWATDYGTRDDSEEQLKYLLSYSPVHNVKPGTAYPATLVTTGENDDRVVPAHSYKFTSALQDGHSGENPILIRIMEDAGHRAANTEQEIEEWADVMSFMFYNLGMEIK